jgi:DNA-binding transcriptional MerR regulator
MIKENTIFKKIDEQMSKVDPQMFGNVFVDLLQPKFSIKDIGITHRWITHWEKEGLLTNPKVEKNEKWRKFNTYEFVWIKLISELRKFKIPFSVIKKLKFIADKPDEATKALYSIVNIVTGTNNEDSQLEKDFYDMLCDMPMLNTLVLDTVLVRSNYKILIDEKGKYWPYLEDLLLENIKQKEFNAIFGGNHLSISISKIILDLYKVSASNSLLNTYQIISEKDKEIIDHLDQKDLIGVEITYKKHEPDLLKITSHKRIDIRSRVIENIIKKGYQSINIITKDGNVKYAETTITHKL